MRDLPVPVSAIEEHFAASLLAVAPPDQLNAVLAQAGDATAVRVLGVVTTTSTSIDAAIDPGPGEPHLVVSITVDSDGIANLVFKPIPLGSRAEVGLAPISLPDPTGPSPVGTDTVVASDATRADRRIPVQLWYPAGTDSDAAAAPATYALPATVAFVADLLAIPEEDVAALRTTPHGHPRSPSATARSQSCCSHPDMASPGRSTAGSGPSSPATDISSPSSTTPATAAWSSFPTARRSLPHHRRLRSSSSPRGGRRHPPRRRPSGARPAGAARCRTRRPVRRHAGLQPVAFAGHSLGGATAAEAMRLDERFEAGINLDGSMVGDARRDRARFRPFLLMGTHDIEEDENWTTFRANTPAALLLAIDGTAHMSYSDWPTLATFRPADEPREGFGIGTIDQERHLPSKRCSYGLSRVDFGDGAGRPVMGHSSARAGSYQARRCRRSGVERRAGRSFAGQPWWRAGISGARPAAPIVALDAGEVAVDLAGDVALEDAHDLGFGASFGECGVRRRRGCVGPSPCG